MLRGTNGHWRGAVDAEAYNGDELESFTAGALMRYSKRCTSGTEHRRTPIFFTFPRYNTELVPSRRT